MALGNLQELIPAIFTGPNGERLTPEQIAQRQEIAQSLMARATDTRPDAGGIASVLTKGLLGFQGAMDSRSADNAIKANSTASEANMSAMLGSLGLGGGNAYPAAVTAGASPTSAVATNTAPMAIPSAPEIRSGLIQRGLPEHVSDAFIANFQDESGLNPGINEINPTVAGSRGGFGLYQLTGPRRREYEAFAAQNGVNPADTNAQLDFLMKELGGSESAAAKKILSSPDTATAAQAIVNDFLRPAPEHRQSRSARYANLASPTAPVEAAITNPELGNQSPVESQITPAAFDARFAGSPEQVAPIQQTAQSPQVPQQVAIDPRLAQLNDMALGGALSESGGSPVAQALAGYFPDAPSASRTPIMPQQQQAQMPMQQAAAQSAPQSQMGGINPAVIQALSSPYATAQEKQIAGLLLNKQMEQQASAQAQQQEIARRQQVAQAAGIDPMFANDPKLWENAVKSRFEGPKTATVGNAVIDVATGKPIYQAPDSTSNMKDYDAYANDILAAGGTPLNRLQYEQEIRKAGSTNITTNVGSDSDEYRKEFDKSMGSAQAKTFTDAMNTGDMARRSRVNLDRLSQLAQSAQQGLAGAAIRSLGEYGIKTEGLGTVQAMESLISQLVPSQRPPGSGVISDADLALYKASLPRLINSTEGNKLILDTLYAINDHDIAASDIASRVADRDLTAAEGRAEMRKIPNPFSNWRDKTSNVGAGDKSRNDPLSDNKRIQDMSDDELRALANGN